MRAAAARVTWPTISSGARGRRQGIGQRFQPEEPERILRIILALDIGEGGACLRPIGADDLGQAEAQPVLAAHDMADLRKAGRFLFHDPGKQRRWRRDMRQLAGKLYRFICNRTFEPAIDDVPRPAVERQDRATQRPARPIEHIDAVAVSGCRNRLDIGRRALAEADRLGDRVRRRRPELIHVPFDVPGLRYELRNAPARHRNRRPVDIEDDGFGDGQTAINSEQTRHSHYSG